jgi:hypothetical protein
VDGANRLLVHQERSAAVLRALWACVRFPMLALLVVLEPIVGFVLGALALLLVLSALFLKTVSSHPIPFAAMLASGVGCVALLALYRAIIRLLS